MPTAAHPLRYLLDTNILSELVRNPRGTIRDRIAEVGENAVGTSIVVACELRFGAAKRRSAHLVRRVATILAALPVLPFDRPADDRYAAVRVALKSSGTPIGPNDLLIAAHALALDLTLVSANAREFARVRGLRVENWLARR